MHVHALHPLPHVTRSKSCFTDVPPRLAARLERADVVPNGNRPWDPQINRPRALRRAAKGTLEAGMAYADGDWDCAAIDELTSRLLRAAQRANDEATAVSRAVEWWVRSTTFNGQSRRRAARAISAHYEHRLDLFEAMLDPSMAYSCAYWRHAATLAEAQDAKHELICRKLDIRPGMRVLDVGCGWGAFAGYAARRHGAVVTGVTISPEQAGVAQARMVGLPVSIVAADYRDVEGMFDRVVSVGMFEHVGPRNYATFFHKLRRWLSPDGLALLHCIGGMTSQLRTDPWIDAFVFPESVLPSAEQITRASEGLFVIEDWHNFGADYDRTLCAWDANVSRAATTRLASYSTIFQRVWHYYLLSCAGIFRARHAQLWQLVLSPHGVAGGYARVS